jgi:hypothetical protein
MDTDCKKDYELSENKITDANNGYAPGRNPSSVDKLRIREMFPFPKEPFW